MKTAIVTGASGGIGHAIATHLEAQGFRVLWHIHTGQCPAPVTHTFRADLRNEAQIETMFAQAEERFGGIHILVNNAGIAQPQQLLTETTTATFDALMATNVRSAFLCCRRALPFMVRQKWGRIINISSIWGLGGGSCEVAYAVTKAALLGLTHALAQEVAPSGITVNAIAPGVIDTAMNSHLFLPDLVKDYPMGRLGVPQDIAPAVAFFASDANSFITGQTLAVSGGF